MDIFSVGASPEDIISGEYERYIKFDDKEIYIKINGIYLNGDEKLTSLKIFLVIIIDQEML